QALADTQPTQRADVVWGSPQYFAPEQARGEKPTPASDVYAIGIILFEMLTGRLPYSGASQQELAIAHLRDRVPLVTEFNPSVPENLAKIVYKVMSKEPTLRYRMADQLGHILRTYRDRSHAPTSTSNMPIDIPESIPPSIPLPPSRQAPPPLVPQQTFSRPPRIPQPATLPRIPEVQPPPAQSQYTPPTEQYGLAPQA